LPLASSQDNPYFHLKPHEHRLYCPHSYQHSILGDKASLRKYKKVEITHCILSDHNGIKLELKSKRWRGEKSILTIIWPVHGRKHQEGGVSLTLINKI
jgi:hypothetical protein